MDKINNTTNNINELPPIIECKNLTKLYGKTIALNDISFTVGRGKITGIMGMNGSGKTTLIKVIAGLLVPSSGFIKVCGKDIGIATKAIVSYLPEKTYLNEWSKVKDTISFFKDFYKDFDEAKAYDMLKRLNVNTNEKLKNMSKGTKEKLQLILVMSRKAEVYLLDEPICGVDPATREYIIRTIISNYSENAGVIISTHLISDIENVLDDVLILENGSIKIFSSADNIRQKYNTSIDGMFREMFKCY